MNYYTATIPPTLAEKLKEKGMPEHKTWNYLDDYEVEDDITYSTAFDWLMEKGIIIYVIKRKGGTEWHYQIGANIERYNIYYDSWHEAANAAIEKALTLI